MYRHPFCSVWTGSVIPCFTCVDVVIGVFIVYWSMSVVSNLSFIICKSYVFPAGCSHLHSKFKLPGAGFAFLSYNSQTPPDPQGSPGTLETTGQKLIGRLYRNPEGKGKRKAAVSLPPVQTGLVAPKTPPPVPVLCKTGLSGNLLRCLCKRYKNMVRCCSETRM